MDEEQSSDNFPEVKNVFLQKYLAAKKDTIIKMLNGLPLAHYKILQKAQLMTIIYMAHHHDVKSRILTISSIRDNLIKIYNRYYNVYMDKLFPPDKGWTTDAEINFKNRMCLVMKDFDLINDLDK
jgi:hypothetical protein